jgi:hypothetical protein
LISAFHSKGALQEERSCAMDAATMIMAAVRARAMVFTIRVYFLSMHKPFKKKLELLITRVSADIRVSG